MYSILRTPAPNLEKSLKFFKKLNFSVYNIDDLYYATDGSVIIHIDPRKFSRPGIVLFQESWKKELLELNPLFEVKKTNDCHILADPNGIFLYLEFMETKPDLNLNTAHSSLLGNFSCISVESLNFNLTIDFWSSFGYTKKSGDLNAGWISLDNKTNLELSVMKYHHCPHLFNNPSLTYFNGKENIGIIEKIYKSGIDVTEEVTIFNDKGITDNIVLTEPGGCGFFVFND